VTARAALVLALIGCGDNHTPTVDAPPPAIPCVATFSGNFAETANADSCAMLASGTLDLAIPTTTLAPSVMASFDLGASPSPGTYSPETVPTWSARGVQRIGGGACLYAAGNAAVPTGRFELVLDAVDLAAGSAHGTLSLTQFVLAFAGTDCGASDTEQIDLQF
jgi:hypothetical protein